MVDALSIERIEFQAQVRGLLVPQPVISSTIAALEVGKFPVILGNAGPCEAFAELVGDQAVDCKLCLGTMAVEGRTAALLSLEEILVKRFQKDFWLIVRRADGETLRSLIRYAATSRSTPAWRLIACSTLDLAVLISGDSPGERRIFAFIEFP